MVLACLFLAWMFLSSKSEPVSIQPTDALVDQVASVKDSLTVDHIPDATKMVDHPGDANKMVEAKKEIVLFSTESCPDCKKWVAIEKPKFEKAGWVVVKSDDPMKGPWPHFIIETNGKQIEHRKYLLFDKIGEVVK